MPMLKDDYQKTEKINGVIYNMSPAANFRHGIVNGNIYGKVREGLKDSLCLVFMENLDYKYHPEVNDDYVVPDIMLVCNRKGLKHSAYHGTPKFIVETLSPATALRDKTEKKEIYEQAGGFEEQLAVAFNDVDFCLKVRRLGKLVVYEPHVQAYHYESKSRGAEDSPEKTARFQREIEYMRNHWIGILKNGDPYYNPNFSSVYNNYSLKDNS